MSENPYEDICSTAVIRENEINAHLQLSTDRWFKNRPPSEEGDVSELVFILHGAVGDWFAENEPQLWEQITHDQRLTQEYASVADFLARLLYRSTYS